jgi:hypothetical protein
VGAGTATTALLKPDSLGHGTSRRRVADHVDARGLLLDAGTGDVGWRSGLPQEERGGGDQRDDCSVTKRRVVECQRRAVAARPQAELSKSSADAAAPFA